MASSRQIEHLERKHQENPEGLTFAPLANAYRNSGQPEQAIEILMQGLEHHPDHAPARIVLGRCHLDLGDDVAAETAFVQVFDLDKENVVALKALADITERNSRFEDATRWLDHLLDADRNNQEARQQLERVTAAKTLAETSGGGESSGDALILEEPEEDQAADASPSPSPTPPEATVDEIEPVTLDSTGGGAESAAEETVDEEASPVAEPSIEPPPAPWEPPSLASEVTEGLSGSVPDGPWGPSEDASVAGPADPVPAEPLSEEDTVAHDFGATLETEDDISLTAAAHNEFQAPEAALDLSLDAGVRNEFQVEREGDPVELRGSADNEFQQPSDAELLLPSEDDAGDQPISSDAEETLSTPDPETAEPGSWFVPAAEEAAASVTPESGPDGTPEPPGEILGAEPAEPPFEESEPLPNPWQAAGDVEEMIRVEADEPSPASSGGVSEDDEGVSQLEVTGDLEVTSEEAEAQEVAEAGGAEAQAPVDEMGSDLYPEVLGSDVDSAPAVEAEPPAGTEPELEPEGEAEPEPEPEPEPAFVATETMAEVFLSQGHRGEALEIYRALLQSTPGDTRLSEKVNALETELEGVAAVGAGEGGEPASETGDEPTIESGSGYAASATGGQTVKALFRGLLAAKPVAPAPPEAIPAPTPPAGDLAGSGPDLVGEPTRPAQDPLSLSSIFGEDTSPVPPAVGGGAAKAETDEGFSFDSFFGDEGGSGSRRPTDSRPKGREDEEDLDRFQSWLQGLKG